ncbi:MAG: phosphatidate cytidylyltransferase [Candidatus Binataceae bacterium]
MLRIRLTTAAVVLPVVLAIVIFASTAVFTIFIGIVTAWGLYEVSAMSGSRPATAALTMLCGATPAIVLLIHDQGPWVAPAAVIVALGGLTLRVGLRGPGRANTATVALGALGVGVLFPYLAFVRNGARGIAIIVLMLLIVVASDSGAYFAGRSLGRIKLLPKVSPHKTVEGAIGGLVASLIAGLVLRPALAPNLLRRQVIAFAIIVTLLAQLGDLANSALKRIAGVKDSGWIFPGHGGLLDRTCSLVFPAVFTYYYFY